MSQFTKTDLAKHISKNYRSLEQFREGLYKVGYESKELIQGESLEDFEASLAEIALEFPMKGPHRRMLIRLYKELSSPPPEVLRGVACRGLFLSFRFSRPPFLRAPLSSF